MSKQSLGLFVHRLHQELEQYREYRSLLNLESHTFVFNKRTLVTQTLAQLQKNGNTLPANLLKEFRPVLKDLANQYGDKLIARLESIAGQRLPRPGGKVTLVFTDNTSVPLPSHYKMDALDLPVFSRVKIGYREILNEFFLEMQKWLEIHAPEYVVRNKDKSIKKSIKDFYDAGHEEDYGVFERFIDEATLNIAKTLETSTDADTEAARTRLVSELKDLGFELSIKKSDSTDSIIIKVESSYLNRQRGAKTGQQSKKLRAAVLKFIEENPLEDLEGSDSARTRKRKKVLKKTLDPFKKLKNVKVTSEDLKIKSSNNSESLLKKAKLKSTAKKVGKPKPIRKTRVARTKNRPMKDYLSLIVILNSKLPRTVQKNMREPGLVNRTGRFASSVKVTDVMQTPQGFPSFGYTYQRNPYQVFETGSSGNWSSQDRDPRILIDKSIREIAAELAIGRFYTRRV